jgi:hypothetical protein
VLHQVLEQSKFAAGVVITFQVMAFAGVSPRNPDAVGPLAQGRQEKLGVHAAGAGDADYPDVGGVFHAADAGQIGGPVAAPIAQEGGNFRFPLTHLVFSSKDIVATLKPQIYPTLALHIKYRSTKSEIRNNTKIQITNVQNTF